MERNVTWKDILQWNPQRIKFLIQGVYNVLQSTSYLCIWGKIETHPCPLCSTIGTLEDILTSCSKVLGEGRYRWRHNQVLKSIAEAISKGIKGSQQNKEYIRSAKRLNSRQAHMSTPVLCATRTRPPVVHQPASCTHCLFLTAHGLTSPLTL
jgi:hypothetical protein